MHVPGPAREKTLRAPREMMKNVQGSSAGAGSGEFHVYKQNRRREYERLKLMDEKAKKVRVFFLALVVLWVGRQGRRALLPSQSSRSLWCPRVVQSPVIRWRVLGTVLAEVELTFELLTLPDPPQEEDQQLFEQRQKANQESADAKTDKNRLRRLKKKARQTGKPLPADFAGGGGGEGGSKKRKLAGGGAQVVFKRPGEESESDEDEGPVVPAQEDEREQEAADEEQAGEDQPKVYVEEQPMIVIHDD